MAAPENLTTASQITTTIREIDFVTQFQKNWDALRTILGISRPIRKAPGTRLVSYKATVDGGLQGGTAVGEGEDIPLTKTKVEPVTYADIELGKWAKAVSIEAVTKYGAEVAVDRTNIAFRNDIFGLETEKLKRIGVAYLQKRGVSLCLAVCKHHRFHLILRQSDANVKVGNNLTA